MRQAINYFVDRIEEKYIFTYIDIGAMGGIPHKWNCMKDAMRVIAFEPDPREFGSLENADRIKYLNYALYSRSADLKYNITKGAGKSSLLKPNLDLLSQYEDEDRFRVVQEYVIPAAKVKNLDSLCEEKCIEDADFIKLDTQGSELSILQGGRGILIPEIFGAQIEVEFIDIYEKQPLFRDVDQFMDDCGFSLMDLRRQYWKRKDYHDYRGKGQLVFGDALYFKKLGVLSKELLGLECQSYGKCKVLKSILICLIYKMYDYAVALAKIGFQLGYLDKVECQNVISEIRRDSPKDFFLNSRLYAKIYGGIDYLLNKYKRRSHLGWSDGDREIGNIRDD